MSEFMDLLQKGISFIPFEPSFASPPLSPQDIAEWETRINAPFPKQYRDYLLHCNGGEVRMCQKHIRVADAYAFDVAWPTAMQGLWSSSILDGFFMIREVDRMHPCYTMTVAYNYNTWKDALPPDTFPIAIDPGGARILIGLKGDKTGKIYFWQLEAANAMEDPETAAYTYLGFIADSFVEFILSLRYIEEE